MTVGKPRSIRRSTRSAYRKPSSPISVLSIGGRSMMLRRRDYRAVLTFITAFDASGDGSYGSSHPPAEPSLSAADHRVVKRRQNSGCRDCMPSRPAPITLSTRLMADRRSPARRIRSGDGPISADLTLGADNPPSCPSCGGSATIEAGSAEGGWWFVCNDCDRLWDERLRRARPR